MLCPALPFSFCQCLHASMYRKLKNTYSIKGEHKFSCPFHIQFSRPEYWSGQPVPFPGDLPNPGIELESPELQVDSLPAELPGKPIFSIVLYLCAYIKLYQLRCNFFSFFGTFQNCTHMSAKPQMPPPQGRVLPTQPLLPRHIHTSCLVTSATLRPHGLQPTRLLCPQNSPDKNTGVSCHPLLQNQNWVSCMADRFFTI